MMNTNANSIKDAGIAASEETVNTTNFFTVFVDKHVYGLDVKEAETIFKVGHVTPIPLIHREVAGFINLRGKIVVAVSLRRRLGVPTTSEAREKFAIGLEAANEHFALLVDRVGDVLALPSRREPKFPRILLADNPCSRAISIFTNSSLRRSSTSRDYSTFRSEKAA